MIRLAWRLAGLTTLADWVGSQQSWFPYATAAAVADIASYWHDHALPQAAHAVQQAGLAPVPPSKWRGLRGLFPSIEKSSPVQAWAEQVALPGGPVLAVIEDVTGSGKTEAAVTLAHRLIADGRAQGIFVALPTMATANAMFGRLSGAYRGLFDAGADPSLALAHGCADLDPRFRAAMDAGAPAQPRHSPSDPADETAEAHCAAWLAEDRRRALLAQVGVGTLDQALLAALPVRHAPLRLWGLAGKVLVIDEAHAFDAYMQREMVALLRFQAALGGSAILLSATLPKALRATLVGAFREGLGAGPATLVETGYPLATLVGAEAVSETPCDVRTGLARRVAVTRLDDDGAAIERIVAAEQAGAAVAWVRNTVDDAIAAAAALRARGVDALLFHARFAMADRLRIEAEVMRRFGHADTSDRAGVLVATQVIEQSLDLDFDLLCTDLARAAAEAEGKRMGQQGIAEQNTLEVWAGYSASQGLWDTDLRTPTRLEDQPQVTLRLAVLRDGKVVPYADDPDPRRAWALSEVRIARHRIASCPPAARAGGSGRGGTGAVGAVGARGGLGALCRAGGSFRCGTNQWARRQRKSGCSVVQSPSWIECGGNRKQRQRSGLTCDVLHMMPRVTPEVRVHAEPAE